LPAEAILVFGTNSATDPDLVHQEIGPTINHDHSARRTTMTRTILTIVIATSIAAGGTGCGGELYDPSSADGMSVNHTSQGMMEKRVYPK
jgi:hypothetical protein